VKGKESHPWGEEGGEKKKRTNGKKDRFAEEKRLSRERKTKKFQTSGH